MSSITPIELSGGDVTVRVTQTLSLQVIDSQGRIIWSTSAQYLPTMTLADGRSLPLHAARVADSVAYDRDGQASRVALSAAL